MLGCAEAGELSYQNKFNQRFKNKESDQLLAITQVLTKQLLFVKNGMSVVPFVFFKVISFQCCGVTF